MGDFFGDREKKKTRLILTEHKCPECFNKNMVVVRTYSKTYTHGKKQRPTYRLKRVKKICNHVWKKNGKIVGRCRFKEIEIKEGD